MKTSFLIVTTIFVLITSLGIQDSFAANPEFISEITVATALAADDTPSNVINVNINPTALTSEKMNLSIFGDTLEITHEKTITRNSTDFTYVGSTPDSKNNVFVTVFGDQARAEIALAGQNYILTPTELNHQIGHYENNLDFSDDVGLHSTSPNRENPDWQNIIASFSPFEYSDDQVNDIIVDVIFLYTPNAFIEKGNTNIRLMANLGIDKTNKAFEESDIPIQLVNVEIDPVGAYRGVNYVEVSMNTDLDRLITINDGYMERGNAVRDKENADIGVLLNKIGTGTTDNCGLAADILGDEVNAFVVVNVMCEQESLIGNVIGHEIGHLFGARHDRASDNTSIPFEFGHAKQNVSESFQTLMVKDPCGPKNNTCQWQTRWSDPDEKFFGTLIYTGTVQYEDNAKVMALAAPYIASFRGGVESYPTMTPPPVIVDLFYDDFETNMDKWFLKSGTQWQTKTPHYNPNSDISKVAGTSNCDIRCSMTMIDRVDLTNMDEPTLSFDRFIDRRVDSNEGLFVYISTNNGLHWIELDSFTDNNNKNDDNWNFEEYSLDSYSSDQIKIKFEAISTVTNEFTEIDDLRVFDAAAIVDTIPPIITIPSDKTFEATAALTSLSDSQIGTVTATDNIDPNLTITNNIPQNGFPLGTTTITYTATDDSGNSSSSTQRVTIRDTTPPTITAPTDITLEATGILTMLALGAPTATDLVDSALTISNDSPNSFPLGTTTITWMATDDFGNSASTTQRVTIQDTLAPVLVLPSEYYSGSYIFVNCIRYWHIYCH